MMATVAAAAVPPPAIVPRCHLSSQVRGAVQFLKISSPEGGPRLLPPVRRAHSTYICRSSRGKKSVSTYDEQGDSELVRRRVLQVALWGAEAVYILWLFLLPYAPGDPVWAISKETIDSLLGLSLNFFFILPLMNSVGIRLIDAPVLHPMAEGLFNFVIGWTFMFAPLLFTDAKKDRYRGSLDALWGLQMFLTNTFLIPYMAIRLNEADDEATPCELSQLGSVMTNGAPIVGLIGGGICLLSAWWALFGRMDVNFGNIEDRLDYVNSKRGIVKYLRFVPVVGLTAYLLFLDSKDEA
ncbi:hypothetical protein MLD38_024389 [Melastoma candidum]|uniref:Uncharacterized protein n=1 Tax=Melastoma candidum TaxID=119954 RepID=A0ACB9NS55_9MYRT|nr:hypothetical protein MLD38_024389 [Melastoma candidum]